jgi:hypothetical protein
MSKAKQNESTPMSPQIETNSQISEQQIAQRAYALYLARGGADGHALDDWLQAERELREQRNRRLKRERKPTVPTASSPG